MEVVKILTITGVTVEYMKRGGIFTKSINCSCIPQMEMKKDE